MIAETVVQLMCETIRILKPVDLVLVLTVAKLFCTVVLRYSTHGTNRVPKVNRASAHVHPKQVLRGLHSSASRSTSEPWQIFLSLYSLFRSLLLLPIIIRA